MKQQILKITDVAAKRLLQYIFVSQKKRQPLTMRRLCKQQFVDNSGALSATSAKVMNAADMEKMTATLAAGMNEGLRKQLDSALE